MTLSSLAIASCTLVPAFDKDVTEYTTTTSNATNKVTATATDEDAELEITVNEDTEIESGESASWDDGENTLAVKVTNGATSKTYTVEVTKETPEPEPGES